MKKVNKNDLFKQERIEFTYKSDNGLVEIKIGRINHRKASKPIETHIHKGSLEATYLVKGIQTYEVENKEYEFNSGEVFIVFPDEVHSSGSNFEDKSLFYYFVINIEDSNNFMGFLNEDGEKLLNALKAIKKRRFRACYKFEELFDRIIELYFTQSPYKDLLIRCWIAEFIIKMTESEKSINPIKQDDLQPVLEYIQKNIFNAVILSDLADIMHMSESYFAKVFKEKIGISPHEYILRSKIETSKNLILKNDYGITHIAHMLGFSSSQYFSTVFKRFTGVSPSIFKNERIKQS